MDILAKRFERIAEEITKSGQIGLSDKEFDAILEFGQDADRFFHDAWSFEYGLEHMVGKPEFVDSEFESARKEYYGKIDGLASEIQKLVVEFWKCVGSDDGENGFNGDVPVDWDALRGIAGTIKAKSDEIYNAVYSSYRLFSSAIAGKIIPAIIAARQKLHDDVSNKFEERFRRGNLFESGDDKYYKFLPDYYNVESLSEELANWNNHYDFIIGDYQDTASQSSSPSTVFEDYKNLVKSYMALVK